MQARPILIVLYLFPGLLVLLKALWLLNFEHFSMGFEYFQVIHLFAQFSRQALRLFKVLILFDKFSPDLRLFPTLDQVNRNLKYDFYFIKDFTTLCLDSIGIRFLEAMPMRDARCTPPRHARPTNNYSFQKRSLCYNYVSTRHTIE